MSYRLKIKARSKKSARFISRLQKMIQKTLIETGMTQQQVAEILEVDRSVVNRRLKSNANLTARSISDFAHAFGKEVEVKFVDKKAPVGANFRGELSGGVVRLVNDPEKSPSGSSKPGAKAVLESLAL